MVRAYCLCCSLQQPFSNPRSFSHYTEVHWATTPKSNRSGVNRRASQNKRSGSSRVTETRNMIESSEAQYASRGDRITVKDKFLMSFTGSSIIGTPITAQALGQRLSAFSLLFTRWRLLKMVFRLIPAVSSTGTNSYTFGVLDDNSGEGGSVPDPTTSSEILHLRASTLVAINPAVMKWNPVDADKWYYTQAGTAGDGRLIVPASLFTAAVGASYTGQIEIHFTAELEGATAITGV